MVQEWQRKSWPNIGEQQRKKERESESDRKGEGEKLLLCVVNIMSLTRKRYIITFYGLGYSLRVTFIDIYKVQHAVRQIQSNTLGYDTHVYTIYTI